MSNTATTTTTTTTNATAVRPAAAVQVTTQTSSEVATRERRARVNRYLARLPVDWLYHLGLHSGMNLKARFGDVKFVCMGGSARRMREFAETAAEQLDMMWRIPEGAGLITVGKKERYSIYKVGPILSVSHGIGNASMSVVLNEVAKLLYYAEATDFCFFRVGTSGGLGLAPGSVVITTEALNAELEPYYRGVSLGKEVRHPTVLDTELSKALVANAGEFSKYVVTGRTVAAGDFYEEQARMDGYLCDIDSRSRHAFLVKCRDAGVRNFEMESSYFAAFCQRAGIPAAVVCATLVDRMKGDQISADEATLYEYQRRAIQVVLSYIQVQINELGLNERPFTVAPTPRVAPAVAASPASATPSTTSTATTSGVAAATALPSKL